MEQVETGNLVQNYATKPPPGYVVHFVTNKSDYQKRHVEELFLVEQQLGAVTVCNIIESCFHVEVARFGTKLLLGDQIQQNNHFNTLRLIYAPFTYEQTHPFQRLYLKP